jgi:hypothetical protein
VVLDSDVYSKKKVVRLSIAGNLAPHFNSVTFRVTYIVWELISVALFLSFSEPYAFESREGSFVWSDISQSLLC